MAAAEALRMCKRSIDIFQPFLHKLGIKETNTCECGESETIEHYLLHCELYFDSRELMRTEIFYKTGEMNISLDLLLTESKTETFYTQRMVIMDDVEIQKCGVKFDPPALVLVYNDKKSDKHRRRTMPLRDFTKSTNIFRAAEELRTNPRHKKYVANMPKAQLERLITIIRDKLNGMSLTASLARNDAMDKVDGEENLNAVDEETLKRKKSVMDTTFEKHQVKPGDPDFKYDVEVEFEEDNVMESGWDSDGSDHEF